MRQFHIKRGRTMIMNGMVSNGPTPIVPSRQQSRRIVENGAEDGPSAVINLARAA